VNHNIVRWTILLSLAAASLASAAAQETTTPSTAPAAPPAAPAPATPSIAGVQVSGFFDGYATANFNDPSTATNSLYNFNTAANSFGLNLAELKFVRPVNKAGDVGFTVALGFGNAANLIAAADPAGDKSLENVLQAYATYRTGIGKGLVLDFGKFVTPFGAEVIESNANWNYSRSLLFALAIPYNHFGLRATYPLSNALSFYGMVVNGWNNVADTHTAKSVGGGFTYSPNTKISLAENYLTGPEQPNDNRTYRKLTDTVLTLTLNSKWALMGNYDYGDDRAVGQAVRWQGVAAYVHYQLTPSFALTPRVEWLTDPQGYVTGSPNQLREITVTPDWKVNDHFDFRTEYRVDRGLNPIYPLHNGTPQKTQMTATSGILVNF
jgi:hypothetical protein